jgi:hypothetical protein
MFSSLPFYDYSIICQIEVLNEHINFLMRHLLFNPAIVMVNGKPSKFLSPLQTAGHNGILPHTGTDLPEYSIRGFGPSPQQVAAYPGME